MLLSRRKVLEGLIAAPAVANISSLMQLRGIVLPTYYHRVIGVYMIATDSLLLRVDRARVPLAIPRGVARVTPQTEDFLVNFFSKTLDAVASGGQHGVDMMIPHEAIDHQIGTFSERLEKLFAPPCRIA